MKVNGFYVGDIIGNSYTHENEKYNKKTKDFELFTDRSKFSDDTILSFATIDWLLNTDHRSSEMLDIIRKFYAAYPDREPTIYGPAFANWIESGCTTYRESYGNGGAMRSSVIGWYADSIEEIKKLVELGITVTHNTEIGRKGGEIVAVGVYILRTKKDMEFFKDYMTKIYKLNLKENIDEYRERYKYTSDPIETVRPAIISLINSTSYEDSVRNAVSFGGDTDTITTICSAISEAYYGDIDKQIVERAKKFLPSDFISLLDEFNYYINKKEIKAPASSSCH